MKRNAKYVGHFVRRNFHLKHVTKGKTEGRIEVTGGRGRRRKQLLDGVGKRGLEIEGESTGSHPVENGLVRGYGPLL